jgi:methyl-accepting chemotaxis protein
MMLKTSRSAPAQTEGYSDQGHAIDCAALQKMLDLMPINVMVCDLENFRIIYANPATIEALRGLEDVLDIKADDLVGTCIDVFHKDPRHQRRLLSNPKNLPHRTQITIGSEILDLLVTAIYDDAGKYLFPMVTWSVVTDKVKADTESARLLQMIDNMPINVMTCDPVEFRLNYINNTSKATLRQIEHLLPKPVDQLTGECIDIFHENPAHQRRILSDLRVSAIRDKDGSYLGPMVCWTVVTEQVKMANDFESNVVSVVEAVRAAATELEASAEAMTAAATQVGDQSTAVAAASEQATTNVETVAAAAEEMSSSIQEISRQVTDAKDVAQDAVRKGQTTNTTVQSMAEMSNQIGDVVNLISDIAAQTNLLALNATIEAARAGDAGKGFAVVASEVKSLANQTAKATDEIAQQIGKMQTVTTDTVGAIEQICGVLGKIDEITAAIAAAVEEQSVATGEISRNVQEAATGTREVSQKIVSVTQASQEGGQSASQVLDAARDLGKQGETLGGVADGFLQQVRAL